MQEFSYSNMPSFGKQDASDWKSLALAGFVHLLLLAFLWIGVQWQSHVTAVEEVEVWDLTSRQAAPIPVPVPEPEVVKEEPEPPKAEPIVREDPEVALEQERQRKLLEKKKIAEQELAKKKVEEKLAAEKLKKEKLAKLDDKKKLAKEKALQDKIFQENMNRLNNQVAKSGSGSLGDALKSTGSNRGDPNYATKVSQKIRANTTYVTNDASTANPTVEFSIQLFPDGTLRGPIKKLKSSGVIAFDQAVEKAIDKSQPFPRDKSGEVPASLTIIHRMKD